MIKYGEAVVWLPSHKRNMYECRDGTLDLGGGGLK